MATVVREVHPQVQPRDLQDGKTATRHFVVFDNATDTNFSNEQQVLNLFGNGTMPTYGEAHPNLVGLVAIDYADLVQDESSPYLWHIRWNYLRTTFAGGANPGTPGYWEYTYRASAATDDAWRDSSPDPTKPQLAFPANGQPGLDPDGIPLDVGGISVDNGEEPGSAIRAQQIVEVTQHREGLYSPSTSFSLLKKRNSNTFLGAQPGRVAYTGISASARLDTNLFSISHQFVWDEWYHMRQQAGRGSSGVVWKKDYDGSTPGLLSVAKLVYWTQPLPKLANFGGPSGTSP